MIDTPGIVYVLHYDRPIGDINNPRGQAQHYIGFTTNFDKRIRRHRNGRSGAGIVRAFHSQGIKFKVAVKMPGTPADEQRLKKSKHISRICPICQKNKEKNNGKN